MNSIQDTEQQISLIAEESQTAGPTVARQSVSGMTRWKRNSRRGRAVRDTGYTEKSDLGGKWRKKQTREL